MGTEFKRGVYDNAISIQVDEFARQSSEFGEGSVDAAGLRGKRGELRTIEKYCKKIDFFPDGGEMDKLCLYPDGTIVDKEVKSMINPKNTVSKVGKPTGNGPREERLTRLINYLEGFEGDKVQEYIRLSCGKNPSLNCINSAQMMSHDYAVQLQKLDNLLVSRLELVVLLMMYYDVKKRVGSVQYAQIFLKVTDLTGEQRMYQKIL